MLRRLSAIFVLCFLSHTLLAQDVIYGTQEGKVTFHSDAPHELIYATSNRLKGVLDIKKKTFAFRIDISSFYGFNNQLQREHFNENYLETSFYPQSEYEGKIIEDVDLSKDGDYVVRTKGKLKIHGVEQERIIKASINCKKGKLIVKSDFPVLLADYNIKIPRIVSDKLSPTIDVSINCTLLPRK